MKLKHGLIFGILFIIIVSYLSVLFVDIVRTKRKEFPEYTFATTSYNDGGSKRQIGLFYKTYYIHVLNPFMTENWLNEDGTIKEEYKNEEYIIGHYIVAWGVSFEKVKSKCIEEYKTNWNH